MGFIRLIFTFGTDCSRKTFASEDAAKRHRDTTESKAFSCANW